MSYVEKAFWDYIKSTLFGGIRILLSKKLIVFSIILFTISATTTSIFLLYNNADPLFNDDAIKFAIMAEIGIDISTNRSKSIDEFRGKHFDYVVTVCDHAKETCPFFPGEQILHTSFQDPSRFKGTEDEILIEVRRIRDEIKDWIVKTFKDVSAPHYA